MSRQGQGEGREGMCGGGGEAGAVGPCGHGKNWILLNSDYGSLPRAGNGAQIGGAGEDLGQEPRQGPDSRATSHLSMSVSRKAGSLEGGTGPCGGFVTLSCIMTSLGFTVST